jgi:predicted ATP-grasp superfamily ATP-dependent carboligase
MPKIFVPDGRSLASLAIVRSLGEKGFVIHSGEEFKLNISFFSRHAKGRKVYPSPKKQSEEFVDEVLRLEEEEGYDLIIPVRDDTTLLLSKYKERFSKYNCLFLSEYESILRLQDKGETVKLALECGVSVPQTYFPEQEDLEEIEGSVRYPVLIRPRVSSGARGIKYVDSRDTFRETYKEVKDAYGEPIIQEYISHKGGHYSIGMLFDRSSKAVAIHVYKETKQYPINGGPAVNAISVEKEDWVDGMLKIPEKLNWVGPAHMDVLYDPEADDYKLLEVNPRFWMSLNLSIKSGVDFPYLLYMLAMNGEVNPIDNYDLGVRYRWVLPNEILWLMQTPDKIKGIKELLSLGKGKTCYGELSSNDPMPVVGMALQGLFYLVSPSNRRFMLNRGWDSRNVEGKTKEQR